jgi:hypothetical protein
MIPVSDATVTFLTQHLHNYIQIENTLPDLKSRTLCLDFS